MLIHNLAPWKMPPRGITDFMPSYRKKATAAPSGDKAAERRRIAEETRLFFYTLAAQQNRATRKVEK